MRRLVDGPDSDLVSMRDAARWLGIGLTLLKELIASGEIPAPMRLGKGRRAARFYWLDLVAWAHLRSINRRAAEGNEGQQTGRRRSE